MAMRLTGMMSGMDTESIIQELVSARRTKVDKAKKAQTKLSWKQEAWKGLNAKLKNLQSKYLSNMRFTSSYKLKTTKVSNSSAVSVITGTDAVNGVQSLKIDTLAKTGYMTGAEIKGRDGSELTALSKLSDITGDITGDGTFNLTTNGRSVDIKVNADTTISDVLSQLKNAGLNASFDAKNKRFFISAKNSGEANDFSLTASDANGEKALEALGLKVNLNSDKATLAEYTEYAKYYNDGGGNRRDVLDNMQDMIDKEIKAREDSFLEQYKSLQNSIEAAGNKKTEILDKYANEGRTLLSSDVYAAQIEDKNRLIEGYQTQLEQEEPPLSEEQKRGLQEQIDTLKEDVNKLNAEQADAKTVEEQTELIRSLNEQVEKVEESVSITPDAEGNLQPRATDDLIAEVEKSYFDKAKYAAQVMADYDPDDDTETGATKVSGQDAVIYLNGARFTGSTNTFEINGLTFTALAQTAPGEEITVTTQDDTDGIYDMVKNFLKEYNAIINEIDKLYNADSAKGYEPLTSEEKSAMAEEDVKEWETKIKDSLLRRDENLSDVGSALKSIMAGGVEVNGKKMYLYNFGIDTLGYFNAADNEKNAYHIDGDADDEFTANNADKLKSMISSDPDTVISFFTKLSQDLYGKMSSLSKSVNGVRTYGNFYDDKKMKSEYEDYNTKIADLEKKLADYEDSWYAKFSKMETAMAKMQSNASAVTSLLGGL